MKKGHLLLFALMTLHGCAYVNPFIEDFNVISVEDEKLIGEKMAAEVSKEVEIVQGSAADNRVNRIGQKLAEALPRREFDYRFYVVEDSTPNAFTIPGAYIYAHTGLLEMAGDDDELAGVLAHEIGHAHERHSAKAISRAYGVAFLSDLLFKKNEGKLRTLALQIAKGGILNTYGRGDEREADVVAYYLLPRAGFSEDGLLRFLQKLEKIQPGNIPTFLSTHPPTPERIERLKALKQEQEKILTPEAEART